MSAVILLGWLGLTATSSAFPELNAALNADKSAVVVTGSNTADHAYQCLITARISVTGQRAFAPLSCTFNLPANIAEKQFCQKDGTGPGSLAKVEGVRSTCVPR